MGTGWLVGRVLPHQPPHTCSRAAAQEGRWAEVCKSACIVLGVVRVRSASAAFADSAHVAWVAVLFRFSGGLSLFLMGLCVGGIQHERGVASKVLCAAVVHISFHHFDCPGRAAI